MNVSSFGGVFNNHFSKSSKKHTTIGLGDLLCVQHEAAVKALYKKPKEFSKVKAVAPTPAKTFENMSHPFKEVYIHWRSEDCKSELDALRLSKDENVQYLVNFRDKLIETKDPSKEKLFTKQLESTALDILRYKHKQGAFLKITPKLGAKLIAFAEAREKQKEISRDL